MPELLTDDLFSKQSVYNMKKYTPIHYHNTIELYYLLNGRVKYFVNNKTFMLKKGDLIIIPENTLHSTNSENCNFNERLLLNFSAQHYSDTADPFIKSLEEENLICIPKEKQPIVEDLFLKISDEYQKAQEGKDILIKTYMTELIIYLYRYRISDPTFSPQIKSTMQAVADFITINYNQDLSLQMLSEEFNLSESHLSKRFKSIIGTNIKEYINYTRIEKAADFLMKEKLSIVDVSIKCGFSDPNYFATVFKKMKGITPYKYMKQFHK